MMSKTAFKSTLKIVGLLKSERFHVARSCAEDLFMKYCERFEEPQIHPMLECEWDLFVASKKIELKGDLWVFSDDVMCFCNDELIGNRDEFIMWAKEEHCFEDFRPEVLYFAVAEEAYRDHFVNNKNTFVFMDIAIDGEVAGRLLFELYSDVCPKTSENFRALCTGERGMLPSGLMMHYLHTPIHRVVPNGWIQAGDILHGRGDSGESIFGETFEDETFAIPHNRRGILGMANKGRHTNASQFYVTLQPTPWMDCKFVAFGALVEGTKILETLENLPTFNERPRSDCRIAACGIFVPEPETILNVDSKTTFGVDSKSIFAGVDSKASVDCVDLKGTVNGVDSKGTVNGVDSKGSLPEVEKATSENI